MQLNQLIQFMVYKIWVKIKMAFILASLTTLPLLLCVESGTNMQYDVGYYLLPWLIT